MNHFEDYLLRRKYNVFRLTHPLDDYTANETQFFIDKELVWSKKRKPKRTLNYFEDFFQSVRHIISRKFDVFIGANSFDMLPALFVRLLGKSGKIVFFGSDFSEDRFESKILNILYILVERISVKWSDVVISNTYRAERARLRLGMDKSKSVVIPNGIFLKNKIFLPKRIYKDQFIYVGSVTREHGLFEMVQALSPLMNKLVIIGQGLEWEAVIELCKSKGVDCEAHFRKDHDFVMEYLRNFQGFGLAPYNVSQKWTYYCSPTKIGEYVASGVPVIVSNVPELSSVVKDRNLGIVYDQIDYNYLKNEIDNFLTDNYFSKAEEFYKDFERDRLYGKLDF